MPTLGPQHSYVHHTGIYNTLAQFHSFREHMINTSNYFVKTTNENKSNQLYNKEHINTTEQQMHIN